MAFATHTDVATRMVRDLTTAEENAATAVIASVTALIADQLGEDSDWAAELGTGDNPPIPAYFKELVIQKAISVIANPLNVASVSQQLGQASRSLTFPRAQDIGVMLSPTECAEVAGAWYGATSGSARVHSMADDVLDMRDNAELDDSIPAQ